MADISKIKLPDGEVRDIKDNSKSTATNWVNGSQTGSVRTTNSKAEDSSYTMGLQAVAEGGGTKASGSVSHAEGGATTASGMASHAEGEHTTASGRDSHAEGNSTTASGDYSHAEGSSTTANKVAAHAEGLSTTASADGAHAEGGGAQASGQASHAEGGSTKASGQASHAEGGSSVATGNNAHAEGYDTTASGLASHAEGSGTKASSNQSHAEGFETEASGATSHAEGTQTIANHKSQHVFGQCNIADPSTAGTGEIGNYIEIVGNGTNSTARSNARTLDWSGNEILAGKLTVGTVGTNSMDVVTIGQLPTKTSDLTNDSGFITGYTETDPTVPSWAKTSSKPTYTASEVGAQPTLVSGSNIKTINDISLLGSGDVWEALFNIVHPIYSFFETTDATFDPNTATGWYGTWELETEGLVHIGAGSTYTVGNTGGNKDAIIPYHRHSYTAPPTATGSHTLTANEIPAHTHGSETLVGHANFRKWTTGKLLTYTDGIFSSSEPTTSATSVESSGSNPNKVDRLTITATHEHSSVGGSKGHTHTITGTSSNTGYAGTSGNTTDANMQPYVVVNRWYRTA